MADGSVISTAEQRQKMANILFWIFVTIFVATAALAFSVLIYLIFVVETPKEFQKEFARILLGGVLLEVAVGVFALWRNLFGLSSAGEVSDLSNSMSELIDGLETNGNVSLEEAEDLRELYKNEIRETKPTLGQT